MRLACHLNATETDIRSRGRGADLIGVKELPSTLTVLEDGKWYEQDQWWAAEAVANAKCEWKTEFEKASQ
jgi:hypothetical protein